MKVKHPPGYTLVTVAGEVDFGNSDEFGKRLLDLATTLNEPRLVVDMGGVEFFDSSGLHALVAIRRAVLAGQGVLVLACLPQPCMKLFERTALDHYFTIRRSLPEAIAAVRPH